MNPFLPTNEVVQSVVAISVDMKGVGAALIYPINDVLYLITAAHVLKGMKHGEKNKLYLYRGDKVWDTTEVVPFYIQNRTYDADKDDTDIALLKTVSPACGRRPLILYSGAMFGGDAYILGFPFFENPIKYKPQEICNGWPIPFIKKGVVSYQDENKIYLDLHNNLGFSGGPVLIQNSEGKISIAGVIAHYLTQSGKVERMPEEVSSSDGDPQLFYKENSGIAVAYNVNVLNPLIRKFRETNL